MENVARLKIYDFTVTSTLMWFVIFFGPGTGRQ